MARLPSTLCLAVAAAIAAFAAAAAAATPAAACSCRPRPPLAAAVAASVYTVRATITTTLFLPDPVAQQERRAEWTADVVGAPFKGCLPRTITISSAANGGLCGVGFAVGDELLLALGPADRDGTFHVALCDTFMAWHSLTADDRRVLMGANDQVCPSRRVW